MTTKYQRPGAAYSGSSGLSNRTKYQDDASANPKVAISSSKMDGDFNYIVDALNTIDEASGTRGSIDERLSVVLNDDGTLKSSIVASLDEWADASLSGISRVDNSTITVNGNQTGIFTAGRRVRLIVSGSPVYAHVAASNYTSLTTVEFVDLIDAGGGVATISVAPTAIAMGPLTGGASGNTPTLSAGYTVRGDAPLIRLKDTGASGKEYALRCDGGQIDFLENTGTETSPTWASRATLDASGISGAVVADDAVTLAKLAGGTAGNLISYDGSGDPVAVATGSSGQVLVSGGAGNAPAFTDPTNTIKAWVNFNGFGGANVSISSLTRSGSTATCTCATNHGLHSGDTVTISGADQAEYNGTFTATPTSGIAFTYTVSGSPVTPATGTLVANPTAIRESYNVTSVVRNGTGDYTVNYAVTMADNDHVASITSRSPTGQQRTQLYNGGIEGAMTTTSLRFNTFEYNTTSAQESDQNLVAIMGELA